MLQLFNLEKFKAIALVVVLAGVQGHGKVFTTGQTRVIPEHYVIKCMGSQVSQYSYGSLSLAVSCSKSVKPTNHFSTLFITSFILCVA